MNKWMLPWATETQSCRGPSEERNVSHSSSKEAGLFIHQLLLSIISLRALTIPEGLKSPALLSTPPYPGNALSCSLQGLKGKPSTWLWWVPRECREHQPPTASTPFGNKVLSSASWWEVSPSWVSFSWDWTTVLARGAESKIFSLCPPSGTAKSKPHFSNEDAHLINVNDEFCLRTLHVGLSPCISESHGWANYQCCDSLLCLLQSLLYKMWSTL